MTLTIRDHEPPHDFWSGVFYSCDPGVNFLGLARWRAGELERAWAHPTNKIDELWFHSDPVVVEMPQKDGRTRRVRMKDVLNLTAAAGRITGRTDGDAIFVTPKQWKGSLPKDVMHERITARLNDREPGRIERAPRKKERGDILDAIGIGLWQLGRLRERAP
jgi:hypothetical protein